MIPNTMDLQYLEFPKFSTIKYHVRLTTSMAKQKHDKHTQNMQQLQILVNIHRMQLQHT
jgi:hypothetical protein